MIKLCNIAISLLLAGSFLFGGGKVKSGVTAEGVEIGGMDYAEAELSVRERIAGKCRPFRVKSPAGDLGAEITYSDDLAEIVRKAKKGEELTVSIRREWTSAEDDILTLCKQNARDAFDARVIFNEKGFFYIPEEEGTRCDYKRSLENALSAFYAGEEESELVTYKLYPKVTVRMLKERTKKLASFTTYFDGANAPRSHNIALAAERISGTVVNPQDEFSFNASVGKRTKENGFEDATVIFDGEFVPGVGGGVCQASTTLMNAALRAGMKITESRSHSLSVGYVPPSLDAMVSDYSDLKFVNPYEFPVYISAQTGENYVRFIFYGKPDGYTYQTESVVRFTLSPPPAEIVEGEEEKVIRAEKEGLASESYLLIYDGAGNLVSRKLFRRDTYAVVQGIYQIVKQSGQEGDEEQPDAREEENSKMHENNF